MASRNYDDLIIITLTLVRGQPSQSLVPLEKQKQGLALKDALGMEIHDHAMGRDELHPLGKSNQKYGAPAVEY